MSELDRTTLVIGAGASVDFGFPTGNDLIQTISWLADSIGKDGNTSIVPGDYILGEVRRAARQRFGKLIGNDYRSNATRVRDGLWLSASIDNYLNEQRDDQVADLGKFLIVAAILLHERYRFPPEGQQTSELFRRPNLLWKALCSPHASSRGGFSQLRSSWLVPFFRILRGQCSLEEFGKRLDKLTLIIFNYDRSVEFFLHQAIMTYDQMDANDASELLSRIQIIHPYETAARLPFQNDGLGVPYGGVDESSFLDLLLDAPLIQTFAEPNAGQGRADAQQAIRISKNLVFMGFGFLEQNLMYLGKDEDMGVAPNLQRQVFCTTYGLSDYQRDRNLNRIKSFQWADTRDELRGSRTEVSRIHHLNATSSELISEFGHEWF